ncbi:glycerol uptake protein, putative [Leishmania tarentolae]|uniref:Glycerol uptake protein, putative n=1 Tax=Leishmania tarentolae TaxID=5689 RepID=A0A640KG34_LEITA|nr:glycerol uptake protein, putative [Leishmania tarentolae]
MEQEKRHNEESDVIVQGASLLPPSPLPQGSASPLSSPFTSAPQPPRAAPSWSCHLHFLSPTTVLDVGAASYNTVYPRWCSIEYLLPAAACLSMMLYGFAVLQSFCDKNVFSYKLDLIDPNSFLRLMGSKGYDDAMDDQWSGFTLNYKAFLEVALLLAGVSGLYRKLISYSTPSASSIPSSSTACSSLLTSTECSGSVDVRANVRTPSKWLNKLRSHARALGSPSATPRECTAFLHRSWILPAFYTIVGVVFVAFVHGPHFILPLLIIAANYVVFTRLQRWCPYWLFMAIMWSTHVTLLYIIEIKGGFEETYWLQYFLPTTEKIARAVLAENRTPPWKQRMRWCVSFRMSTLRLIAFNYDLWEATHAGARARDRAAAKHDTGCVECAQLREQNAASAAAMPAEASRCYKYRTEYARDLADYNFLNYAAYMLFPPLYLAGPMSSFNAFVSHMRVPSTSMPLRTMVRYAFGILRIYITEYVLLHFVHIPCIGSYTFVIPRMSLLELAYFLFYMLAYLWLKFSFLWKSSRLFAMFSGIEAPEDMRRCFANTLTVRDFWRDWHASFNLWIVRYMYIPMGGRSRVALSVLPIFLFIALWHDPSLHLVKWALCIAVMFVAEMVVIGCFGWATATFRREMAAAEPTGGAGGAAEENGRTMNHAPRRSLLASLARFSARRFSPVAQSWMYRQIRVVAGMTTVLGLIISNLVGFSMQNAEATMKKHGIPSTTTDADNVIKKALHSLTPLFTLGLITFMYALAALAAMDRDMAAHHEAHLKLFYRLKQ